MSFRMFSLLPVLKSPAILLICVGMRVSLSCSVSSPTRDSTDELLLCHFALPSSVSRTSSRVTRFPSPGSCSSPPTSDAKFFLETCIKVSLSPLAHKSSSPMSKPAGPSSSSSSEASASDSSTFTSLFGTSLETGSSSPVRGGFVFDSSTIFLSSSPRSSPSSRDSGTLSSSMPSNCSASSLVSWAWPRASGPSPVPAFWSAS
mmetsp:Transcript_5335/g.16100  ORF Transcript_5335/g.16100 Transcript_5335/m.16100 type:complete len:203 (-) Transcript_5335:1500-2108(-)